MVRFKYSDLRSEGGVTCPKCRITLLQLGPELKISAQGKFDDIYISTEDAEKYTCRTNLDMPPHNDPAAYGPAHM